MNEDVIEYLEKAISRIKESSFEYKEFKLYWHEDGEQEMYANIDVDNN